MLRGGRPRAHSGPAVRPNQLSWAGLWEGPSGDRRPLGSLPASSRYWRTTATGSAMLPGMVWIAIEVRDGRVGRDPTLVTSEGGEVLYRFETDVPYALGDLVHLPDGTDAKVISLQEQVSPRWQQVVTVGDTWN